MTDFYTLSSKELADINAILVRKTEVSKDSSCFCVSGKKFSSCCRSSPNFWLTDKFKDTLLGFIKSKNWVVDEESVSFIFPTFEKLYLDRLDLCARPNCGSKTTINSHVYGKKHIQGYLNGIKCRIHNPYSTSRNFFNETHTGRELTYRIFCKKCDSELFRNIDNPRQNTKNENNQFLHLLRTIVPISICPPRFISFPSILTWS